MRFAKLALFFAAAAASHGAPIYMLKPGESVKATLRVPAETDSAYPPNSEIVFMGSIGGIVVGCTNCLGDPVRSRALFLGDGMFPGSNYHAYVPKVPYVEMYDLTLTLTRFSPIPAPIYPSVSGNFNVVENPEPSPLLLLATGIGVLVFLSQRAVPVSRSPPAFGGRFWLRGTVAPQLSISAPLTSTTTQPRRSTSANS